MIHVVNDLLLLARAESASLELNKKPVSLAAFCEENRQDWETLCELKDQSLKIDVEAEVQIRADERLLSQMFMNLVSNASKYSESERAVGVTVRSSRSGERNIEICVEDEGSGIPADQQDRVFERFYRVKNGRAGQIGGSGLGLPISRMIAEVHDGRIRIESEDGQGTRVVVDLPALVLEQPLRWRVSFANCHGGDADSVYGSPAGWADTQVRSARKCVYRATEFGRSGSRSRSGQVRQHVGPSRKRTP